MVLKNPEILPSAFNYRELLIKETLVIQEQQPEISVDNFSTPLYLSICRFYVNLVDAQFLMLIHIACIAVGADVDISC